MLGETQFDYQNQRYQCDLTKPIDISIPLVEGSDTVNCYFAEAVSMEVIRFGDSFVGSVAEGGSCNYQKVSLTPHGNGTHTECYGHISKEKVSIHNCLQSFHFFVTLVSLTPKKLENGDAMILLKDVQEKLAQKQPEALIIRTLPNKTAKKTTHYSNTNPPYLEGRIGTFLAKQNIKHLLVDLPSVDRESDGGVLQVHHDFWQYPQHPRTNCTITELVYVPSEIPDGDYLLNLQIISLDMDASPSKPVLYQLKKIN